MELKKRLLNQLARHVLPRNTATDDARDQRRVPMEELPECLFIASRMSLHELFVASHSL
jgi:hypothetical protein